MLPEGYIGRKHDRPAEWFIPRARKLRFVVEGGRCKRAATAAEVEAFRLHGGSSPVLLSRLVALAATQAVPPPAEAEASVDASAGTSSAPRRRGRK